MGYNRLSPPFQTYRIQVTKDRLQEPIGFGRMEFPSFQFWAFSCITKHIERLTYGEDAFTAPTGKAML